jgi:hypothetical protein
MVTAPARTILPGAGVNPVAGIGEERQALAMRARWKRMPVGNFSNNQDQFVKLEIAAGRTLGHHHHSRQD